MSIPPNIIADRVRILFNLLPKWLVLIIGSLPSEKIAAIRSEIQNELQSKNAGNGSTGSEPNKSG